jgi:cytochrome c
LASDKNHILKTVSKLPLNNFKDIKMKITVKLLAFAAFAIILNSCGKKEDQDFNKNTPAKATATTLSPAEKGKEIFEGKGTCITCHKPDVKVIGPSLMDISKIYKEKKASIATFLKGDEKPLVDPTQFEVMKANFALTKTFTDEERQSLEAYIHSFSK